MITPGTTTGNLGSLEAELLARVREIAPVLRNHAEIAERERRLSKAAFEAMRGAELYKIWLPRAFGGFEADPITAVKVFEAVAREDSAAGWNLQIAAALTIVMAWLPSAGAEEICGDTPICAGAFFPPGRAVVVDGGYRVTARCPFSSGCHEASWFCCQAQVIDGDEARVDSNGRPTMVLAFFHAHEGEIVDTWNAIGMRGTGSHDTIAADVFVPDRRIAHIRPLEDPGRAYSGPLYRTSVWSQVAAVSAPAIGIAEACIAEVLDLGEKIPSYLNQPMGEKPVVQSQVAEATAMVGAARAYLHTSLDGAYRAACEGRLLNREERIQVQLATVYAIRSTADAVDLVCRAAGTRSIREGSSLQRHLRDSLVITRHAYASTSRYESVGKLLFGLETDWPFFWL